MVKSAQQLVLLNVFLSTLLGVAIALGSESENGGSEDRDLAEAFAIENHDKHFVNGFNFESQKAARIPTTDSSSIDNKARIAVIHAGPQKTGSTSIQANLNTMLRELDEDQYAKVPDINPLASYSFSHCFRPNNPPKRLRRQLLSEGDYTHNSPDYSCYQKTLDETKELATKYHKNILISSETLAHHSIQHAEMKKFLSPHWDHVRVILYYRRFYSWLVSLWSEQNKHKPPPERTTKAEFFTIEKMEQTYNGYYILPPLQGFSEQFDDVQVYNLHNLPGGDAMQTFFCEALPDAKHTCEKYKEKLREGQLVDANHSPELVYGDLAYWAKEMDLIENKDLSVDYLAEKARVYQEEVLQLSKHDWKHYMACLDDDQQQEALEWLLKKSQEIENILFPEFYKEQGKDEILTDFQKYTTTKFCTIDAKQVLEEEEGWAEFFSSIVD